MVQIFNHIDKEGKFHDVSRGNLIYHALIINLPTDDILKNESIFNYFIKKKLIIYYLIKETLL